MGIRVERDVCSHVDDSVDIFNNFVPRAFGVYIAHDRRGVVLMVLEDFLRVLGSLL